MTVYSVYIINKSGSLIYQKNFSSSFPVLSANDHLIIAGTLHSIYAISTQIGPSNVKSKGIQTIDSEYFRLFCHQTRTGVKILVLTDPSITEINSLMKSIYIYYADFVTKNPFQVPDMPIRSETFDTALKELIGA